MSGAVCPMHACARACMRACVRARACVCACVQLKALAEEVRVTRLEREHMSAQLQMTDQRASSLELDMREKEAVRRSCQPVRP